MTFRNSMTCRTLDENTRERGGGDERGGAGVHEGGGRGGDGGRLMLDNIMVPRLGSIILSRNSKSYVRIARALLPTQVAHNENDIVGLSTVRVNVA